MDLLVSQNTKNNSLFLPTGLLDMVNFPIVPQDTLPVLYGHLLDPLIASITWQHLFPIPAVDQKYNWASNPHRGASHQKLNNQG
jgi:hypothetical protein